MVFSFRLNADVFIRFVGRLLKATDGRNIILVIDSHPAHKAAKAACWIDAKQERRAKIGFCFMRGCSPEINPDKMLTHDTKPAMWPQSSRHQSQMIAKARSHPHRT
jgi:hypothetical protein